MVLGELSAPVGTFPLAALLLYGLIAAQRLGELALSRRHLRGRSAAARAAGGRGDWTAMLAVHTALLVLPLCEAAWLGTRAPRALCWSALGVFALAQLVRVWTLATLGRAWNARAVVDPNLGFVTRGPYRWIRHPNYLAVLLEFATLPLVLGAWRSWILLNAVHAVVLARRVRAEEALLDAIPGYRAAMSAKGRFLPR